MNITIDEPTPLHLSRIDYPKKEHPEISGCCNRPMSAVIEYTYSIDQTGKAKLENKKKTLFCTKCEEAFPAYNLKRKNVMGG